MRTHPRTTLRLRKQSDLDARADVRRVEYDPYTENEIPPENQFPVPVSKTVKMLGVVFDNWLSLDGNNLAVIHRAQIRMGALAKIARATWGIEAIVLRMTHDAIIVSLPGYGLVVTGSCLPPDLIGRMDTHIVNKVARRIGGLGRNTRIQTLHFLAGAMTFRNMYVLHCAEFFDAALRAFGSTIAARLRKELEAILKADTE